MVNIIRRFQKPLLLVLVFLVIISYVVFYNMNPTRGGMGRSDSAGTIYGEGVSSLQLDRAQKRFEVTFLLKMGDVLFALGGREAAFAAFLGQDPGGASVENYIWNSMVLRHESEALGVAPTESEIEAAVKSMPAFQTNGAFDYSKYALFSQNVLTHRGFTSSDLQDVIADQVRLTKVRGLIGSTIHPPASAVREQYIERNQKNEVSFFRLKLEDFKAGVQVSDEDVSKLFTERQATLKTPEKRKVKFVGFTLANESKPLTGKDRAAATQRLAERAQDFAIAMTEKGATLEAVAAKQNLTVAETPAFAQEEPPSELSRSEPAAQAAFRLTKEEPNSDVVNAENGYYVLQLSDIETSRPLSLEEAKGQLTEQLKQERAQESLNLKAAELRTKVDAELKAGKPLEEAATMAGVTLEKIPAFSAADSQGQEQPEIGAIKARVAEMKEGELSEFLPTATGGVVAHLDKRLPVDEAAFEKEKANVAQGLERQEDEAVFQDWLRIRRTAADIRMTSAKG